MISLYLNVTPPSVAITCNTLTVCLSTFISLPPIQLYYSGISASTGLPFSPPIAYRQTKRLNVGKKEKSIIQEGKCHKCTKWVAVEGIKDMESKVRVPCVCGLKLYVADDFS
jgi:hypothetical protein